MAAPDFETPSKAISLYPNPNNGVFTIQIVGVQNLVPSTIEIYNILGEKVYSKSPEHSGSLANSQGLITIDLNQPNGMYLYRVISTNGDLVGEGKLIINK